jgi:hypothetical protein
LVYEMRAMRATKRGATLRDEACPECGRAIRERKGRLKLPVNGEEIAVPDAPHLLSVSTLSEGRPPVPRSGSAVVGPFSPQGWRILYLYLIWLTDARLYEVLARIDDDLAETARRAGCAVCQGVLHSARFPRKPRGGPAELPTGYDRRHSFCCAADGCRKRRTPP